VSARMRPLPVVLVAAGIALAAAGCDDDDAPTQRQAVESPTPTASPVPTPAPRKPRAVRLTIGVTGDLLPHLPIVARARTARGYDFRPMLRPIRRWVRANDLAFCHVETPLLAGTPAGYPRFSSPPALARAVKATGFDACSTASNHSVDRGQAGIDSTRSALNRARLRHTGAFSSPRQRRKPVILRARGVKVALLAYTQMTNGLPLPHGWSVNLATAPRILADARRARRAGARVVIVNLHWGTEFVHAPDAFQASLAKRLARSKAITAVVGQHAHVVQPIRRVGRLWVVFGEGNLLSNQTAACCPTASQDGMLVRLHLRVGPRRERVDRIAYTPTYVRHPDYAVVRAPRASYARTVAVVGRKPRVRPQRSLKQRP
jgi:poly-gamma-glutamate capsule biosynthesis protein CapA/YwtB (metallophosphatase superfamily)